MYDFNKALTSRMSFIHFLASERIFEGRRCGVYEKDLINKEDDQVKEHNAYLENHEDFAKTKKVDVYWQEVYGRKLYRYFDLIFQK